MNVGILLAAGASRRMGRSKSLMRAGGETFLARGVRHLWHACDVVVVVLGSGARHMRHALEGEFVTLVERGALHRDLMLARRHGAAGLEVRIVENRAWRTGMLSSVRAGLATALRLDPALVLVLPVDHPSVRPDTVRALAAAMGAALASYGAPAARGRARRRPRRAVPGFAYALVPRYRRRRGHPVALSPALARAIAADRGASDLSDAMRRSARLVGFLDCGDSGVVRNRNTPRD
ncbi:MAG: NTP transferase domain-containing protein [Candidatus Eisenbacteria bacterium]|uniref:NTP transferase domain-containing protein n=1 Tax=Eiseniibacteriota bacterium TaxID=2212470 RepID=A0A9D6LB55_UNCEI|nr:NTP transferase domain-containing protein [Candidatus Eisenbacteria bacterium]